LRSIEFRVTINVPDDETDKWFPLVLHKLSNLVEEEGYTLEEAIWEEVKY